MVMRSYIAAGAILLAGAAASSAAQAQNLGSDLSGSSCQIAGSLTPDQSTAINCGGMSSPVGKISYVPAPTDPSAQRAALLEYVATQNENLDCAAAQWAGASVLRTCTLKSNGWPRIVVGMSIGGRLYRGEGPPSLLPVLEGAAGWDSHGTVADSAALLATLKAKLPAATISASASDYATYGGFIESARLAGAAFDYASAESNDRKALAIEEKLFGETSIIVGQTMAELALQISNQGRFQEAAGWFHRATPIIEGSNDASARARLDSYLALDAANQRHFADALNYARQATAARREEIAQATQASAQSATAASQQVPVSQGELAHALRIESEMALRLDDLAGARAAAEEALWIVSDEPGLPLWWRPDTVALIGEINERAGRVQSADHDLHDARDLDLKLFGATAPTALADLRLGEFYVRQQVYPAALDAFHAGFAIATNDKLARAEVTNDDVAGFATAQLAVGDPATRDGEIYRAAQLVKSGVADQTIARVAAREAASDSKLANLVAMEQGAERDRDMARVQLAAEDAKPNEERDETRVRTFEASLKVADQNVGEMSARLQQSFPDYEKLSNPGPADLPAVQASLEPNEALISFVFGRTTGYALIVRPHAFVAVPLTLGEETLRSDVADLRRAFAPAGGHLAEFDLQNSYELYRSLLGPAASHLQGVDHLIVVPGPILDSLPLSLLVTEPPAGHDYQHAAWLIRRFAVSVVPSPGAFVTLASEQSHHTAPQKAFLGIGNPAYTGANGAAGAKALADLTTACQPAGPVSAELLRQLAPLPGTEHEVDMVGARIGGGHADILLGAQATEANFRAQPLDQFGVIYFATHGILPGELHCQSEPGLALSPPATPAASTATDGMLEASEIADLKLNADLVVLSACNTAEASDGLGGSALEGLSDSFFAAGARAVLASHWEVPSSATESLMIGTFDPANSARGIAEGLRQSQLALIAKPQTAHPFYWAAFTLIGNSGTGNMRSAQLTTVGHP